MSQNFIYATKTGAPVVTFIDEVKNLDYEILKDNLQLDEEKKAFWINLYNGFTQAILKKNPIKYKNRNKFFKSKFIKVAGKAFSLDNIEHGILRHSKIKWSFGYLNKSFPVKTEKELRVKKLDYRVHFALNCGAKSCPPIAFYDAKNINAQLDLATRSYLTTEAVYDSIKNILYLPAIMKWFFKDFGGKKNIIQLMVNIDLIPKGSDPEFTYKEYDWSLYLDHYKTEK